MSRCPMCGSAEARESWFGALRFAGRVFPYVECTSCASLYADPMPGDETLAQMYGPQYEMVAAEGHEGVEDPKQPTTVVGWLKRLPAGTFLDYGCGSGRLLADVSRIGWRVMGVEFDPSVAAATAARVGATVLNRFTVDTLAIEPVADVLHLGDVVEHLTKPDEEMPNILRLLKPGGYLMAQGPLEANACLFTGLLKLSKRWRGSQVADMPPYHVVLATADGQRAFFARFGLTPVLFSMREVAWPAPARIGVADLGNPRAVALFAARRLSQACSAIRPDRWGNRYFYVGQRA